MNIKYGKSKRIMASEDYATLRGMDFRKARDILTKDGFHEHEYGDKDDNNGYAVYRKGDKEVELQYRWNQGKRKGEAHAGKVTNVYVDDSVNSACGKKSVKANRRSRVMASNNGNASVSKIKKFIEDSVNRLQNSDYTNSRLILDDDLCLYVGYASGFDTKDGYAICAKIAERNDADWSDFDYLNMPWNTYSDNDGSTGVFEGDVYDTDIEITPGEDYTQDAQWLADSYVEIRNLLDEGKLTINASYTKKSVNASRRSVNASTIMGAADISNSTIYVPSYCYVDVMVDSYEQGEGEQVNSWTFQVDDAYSSGQALINSIADASGIFSDNIDDYVVLDSSLQTDATVNVDNMIPTDAEIEAWKRGELELYVAHLWVRLQVGSATHDMSDDEAEAFGLSVY